MSERLHLTKPKGVKNEEVRSSAPTRPPSSPDRLRKRDQELPYGGRGVDGERVREGPGTKPMVGHRRRRMVHRLVRFVCLHRRRETLYDGVNNPRRHDGRYSLFHRLPRGKNATEGGGKEVRSQLRYLRVDGGNL